MARNGSVYLFGTGNLKLNPIDGVYLVEVCVHKISSYEKKVNIGGPDLLTQNEFPELALQAWNKKIEIIHLPN